MTGAGAHRAGGRWNSPGRHVVYTAGNLTLAMLELLVHLAGASELHALGYVAHTVGFPEDAVTVLGDVHLPRAWHANPVSSSSQVAGDEWLDEKASLVLAVPSVIVPTPHRYDPAYMNYLIDPEHPDFEESVEVGRVFDLGVDSRLLK